MKLALVHLLSSLCATAIATGIRGSAERIYMQEEIFEDPARDGGIASGCVGTRRGLRGQVGRCTLRQLCEYIWAPTNENSQRPDPAKMIWPRWDENSPNRVWRKNEISVSEAITRVVEGVEERPKRGRKKGVYYNGFWDASRVLPGFGTEPSEYYRAARELGDWEMAARKEINKQLKRTTLTQRQKSAFRNWNRESQRAVKLVVGLRKRDLNEFTIKQMRRAGYFGRPIAITPTTGFEGFRFMRGAKEPDRGGTIVAYELQYPGGRDQVIMDYDAAMDRISQTNNNMAHRYALSSWEFSRNRIVGCRPVCLLTSMHSIGGPVLPTEIILLIATYLKPLDQISLLQVFPSIAGLFNLHQFAASDENGDTILHLQARKKTATEDSEEPSVDIPFYPSLLDSNQGAILHPQNRDGTTPLMDAAFAGNIPFMQLVLEKDPGGLNLVDENGATALWYAVYAGEAPAIALLLEQPTIDVNHQVTVGEGRDAHQITPLLHALWNGLGEYDTVSLLIKHPETDLTVPDMNGETAIHMAIRQEREDLVRDILECGRLDVNSACGPWTPLHTAAGCGDVGLVKLLLAQDGIEVNRPTPTGETPLMNTRSPRCMKVLLAHPGIEVDLVDDFGWSALGYTAYQGDLECARVLLRHGARPDLLDLDGYTPKERAEQAKQWDLVKLLEGAVGQK
ncbi:ankyrin repeat-containing domain protein [Aspergillus pseudoustus]|uniref:Ankyrin repeat-containing domain protein n=1 Tax=Aspergillus pseudoustus TaxID=1810923 RepID=A0ABR4IAH5_9EURO